MTAPIVQTHSGIWVVRDDLHPGGTKARFIGKPSPRPRPPGYTPQAAH